MINGNTDHKRSVDSFGIDGKDVDMEKSQNVDPEPRSEESGIQQGLNQLNQFKITLDSLPRGLVEAWSRETQGVSQNSIVLNNTF